MTDPEKMADLIEEQRRLFQRMHNSTIAEYEAKLAGETNPYEREHLQRALQRFREIAAQ